MRYLICFFDSSMQLVPREIASHPQVVKNALRRGKKPCETMLERSKHHKAILKLKNSEKTGRPDILHTCLKIVSDSPVYRRGLMDIIVHTIEGKWVVFRDRIRFPVTYDNFIGLMEELLIKGRVLDRSGRVLMEVVPKDYVLKTFALFPHKTMLSERGVRVEIGDYVSRILSARKPACFFIGAYPKGNPSREIVEMIDEEISIYEEILTAWTVTSWLTYEFFKQGLTHEYS
ncbi:MAG: 16S rRNA methyltransferase [Candidatus Brockarchaeota archaeon]|nr:16S rRNA methyltransferase [Candidatus Brockarchaeota archaeon]